MNEKKIIIIGGPNGAGKTTFANEFLPKEAGCLNFINADLIASGLSPFNPEKAAVRAGKIMLELINAYVRHGQNFAFETTLSGKNYARMIPEWQSAGYRVKLFFLSLPDPEFAIERIRQRICEGGHDVPDIIVRRRFYNGLNNFEKIYKCIVDEWAIYDNSSLFPILINEGYKQ
ncbi:MAG: Zeta toxin family protein [Desulfobacteraceae bacterium IS3]|nr:MAG: Zeta toxin family protein [Desulfobacteraceae bacterium IS3]